MRLLPECPQLHALALADIRFAMIYEPTNDLKMTVVFHMSGQSLVLIVRPVYGAVILETGQVSLSCLTETQSIEDASDV